MRRIRPSDGVERILSQPPIVQISFAYYLMANEMNETDRRRSQGGRWRLHPCAHRPIAPCADHPSIEEHHERQIGVDRSPGLDAWMGVDGCG